MPKNEFRLNCSFQEFKTAAELQIEKFSVLRSTGISNSDELQTARQQRRDCYKDTIAALKQCFYEPDNELVRDFARTEIGGFVIAGAKKSLDTEIKEFRESCDKYIQTLRGIVTNGSLSDIMVRPEDVNLEERSRMTVEERQLFILKKLSEVNNGIIALLDFII